MGEGYDQTHRAIIKSAKNHFLERGFKGANLRSICKDANVTTGAFYRHFKDKEQVFHELVSPVVKKMRSLYAEKENRNYNNLEKGNEEEVWNHTESDLSDFMDVIYDSYDEFRLILVCSEGTAYKHFVQEIVLLEKEKTQEYMEKVKEKGIMVNSVDEDELYMLLRSYYGAIFQVVICDCNREKAKNYAGTLVKFFQPGWQQLFGI